MVITTEIFQLKYFENFVNLYQNVLIVCITLCEILTSNQPGLLVLKLFYSLSQKVRINFF